MMQSGTTLCDIRIGASLDALVKTFSAPDYRGAEVEIWVFDGPERRAKARECLEGNGVHAKIRSAYKPLVHTVIEETDFDGAEEIIIRYPVVDGVSKGRFLLECYPVVDLVGDRSILFEPDAASDGTSLPFYRMVLRGPGRAERVIDIAAPNAFHDNHTGHRTFTSTGWVRVRVPLKPELDRDEAFRTDQEEAFAAVMGVLETRDWPGTEAHFDRLNVSIEAPFYDTPLTTEGEWLSTGEAMHEDLYFSALELLKTRRGHEKSDRVFAPGQIVPEIVPKDGPLRVRLTTSADPWLETDKAAPIDIPTDLEAADHWLEPGTIKAHLDALGGQDFEARSRRGRPVWGTHVEGPGPNVLITAGQHANESSGPVGALRAAHRLKQDGKVGFAIAPLKNPDGYALFRELAARHPRHMNHAARYTAGGCDLEYTERGFENEILHMGKEKTGAKLHLNLHGYPSHEWTRPFTGYVPRDFDQWTLPKGFFLILRCHAGWEAKGDAILQAIIDALASYRPIVELNRKQLERSRLYLPEQVFEVRRDIPVLIEQNSEGIFPVTIITEAPDETIYGEEFIVAHTAQMMAVLAAANACAALL